MAVLLLFYILVFVCKACRVLAPRPEVERTSPALEGEVLVIGPPGKSLEVGLSEGCWAESTANRKMPQMTASQSASLSPSCRPTLTPVQLPKIKGTEPPEDQTRQTSRTEGRWGDGATGRAWLPSKGRGTARKVFGKCFFFLTSFLKILFFNWRIIALQNFVVFCQTSTWISHRYTYIPSLLNLPPISYPISPF